MDLHSINCFRNGLLGLAPYGTAQRKLLIEEGAAAANLMELLEEWIWTYNIRESEVLKLKVWLGLSTADLAEVFRRSHRDISQLLRNQRAAYLPTYPAPDRAQETSQVLGLSCFMVEQYLSAWIDQELIEVKVGETLMGHCHACEPCRTRLQMYRDLQETILKERPSYPPIEPNEWSEALAELRQAEKRQIRRIISFLVAVVLLASVLAWVFLSKPEKIPNVYELPETREN